MSTDSMKKTGKSPACVDILYHMYNTRPTWTDVSMYTASRIANMRTDQLARRS